MAEAYESLLDEARKRYKFGTDANASQALRIVEDVRFYNGEQWPADLQLLRQGQQANNGMPAVPARPTLTINKVKEPVRQIINQQRASEIGIELVPADDFGDLGLTPDDTEVNLREGLIRRIQRESIASDARTWAFTRAVIAGEGYYLLRPVYLPGKTFDQEIRVERIYDQSAVVLDPTHVMPDGSDACWEFIGTWVPWSRYAKDYPHLATGETNPYADRGEAIFMSLTEDYPDWYRSEGEERAVRVVDYWYTESVTREIGMLSTGQTVWMDEASELPEGVTVVHQRTEVSRTVKYCKIGGGVHVLEETTMPGPDLPIVKVLGEELLPVDGKRESIGVVHPAKDSQRGFNYLVSRQVEVIGLTPIPPLMVDPEGIEGYEAWYGQLNIRTFPYLPYRTWGETSDRPYREPHRPPVDPNIMPISQSVGMFDALIKSTTAVPDPTLGNVDPSLKSGRAIREVVANAKESTSNFLDNLARSMRYEGQIINNWLYPIYGETPGRLVRIMTGEGDPQMMLIENPEKSQPEDPQWAQQQAQRQQRAAKVAKLTKDAKFNILVKIGRSFDSRRQQMTSVIAELISADPQQMGVIGDLLYKSMDVPGHKEMADRQRVMLAPPVQQMLQQREDGAEIPPEAAAKIAQLEQQMQQAMGVMQEMDQALKQKQIEAHADLQKQQLSDQAKVQVEQLRAQLEHQRMVFELEKAKMDNATRIHVAEIAAKTKGVIQAHELEHESMALLLDQAHESEEARVDREAKSRLAAHQAVMSDAQSDRADVAAERDRRSQADGDY